LGTTSGSLVFRDATGGVCVSESSAENSLTALPSTWLTGTASSACPISVFGDSAKLVFFDTFAETTLSPEWTVISRHGEYSQNETECNIPQQVTVANGLTISTVAQTWTCGDFHPDGTVWHAPAAWPYITGDIQWTSLNFTYGTVEIRAKFPAQATSLWPATWLLGSSCQSTNPLTGDTGVGTCPNLGASGYTEIDMTECYGSGWCQFHVANPGFGSCDGTYVVDTNFHTFKTVWNSSGITQFMDGVAVTTCNQKMSNPMFLIIQTQTGGAGGTPNGAFLPANLVVSYVKVTQP
jgi:beta-glucanase (GH16 family)